MEDRRLGVTQSWSSCRSWQRVQKVDTRRVTDVSVVGKLVEGGSRRLFNSQSRGSYGVMGLFLSHHHNRFDHYYHCYGGGGSTRGGEDEPWGQREKCKEIPSRQIRRVRPWKNRVYPAGGNVRRVCVNRTIRMHDRNE